MAPERPTLKFDARESQEHPLLIEINEIHDRYKKYRRLHDKHMQMICNDHIQRRIRVLNRLSPSTRLVRYDSLGDRWYLWPPNLPTLLVVEVWSKSKDHSFPLFYHRYLDDFCIELLDARGFEHVAIWEKDRWILQTQSIS